MKTAAVLFAAACLATTAYAEQPEVKYDRFTQTTTIQVVTGPISAHHVLLLLASLKGAVVTELDMGAMNFNEGGWQYLQCHNVEWLVDGRPLELGKARSNNSVIRGDTVAEHMFVTLTPAQLAIVGSAHSIEYKICNDEFKVDDVGIDSIHQFKRVFDQQIAKAQKAPAPQTIEPVEPLVPVKPAP